MLGFKKRSEQIPLPEYPIEQMPMEQPIDFAPPAPGASGVYDESFLRFAIDNESIIKKIERKLLCMVYDDEKKKWVQRDGIRPLLNKYGIGRVITLLHSLDDKGITLSNLDQKDIENAMKAIAFCVNDLLYEEWDLMGLQNPDHPDEIKISSYNIVFEIIINTIYAALKRAKDGFQQKIIGNVYKQEDKNQLQQRSRGGLLSRINPLVRS